MSRFLHTSDWQLGMTRHFFSEGAQERYSQARFDAIRTMGRIAEEEKCQFILVSGDVFESNQVDRKTVARALEALKDVSVPIFILPGNHDPLNSASVYNSSTFIELKPDNVHIISDMAPVRVADDIELVGAPWVSKRPVVNPVEELLESLDITSGVVRICMAHGAVDELVPDPEAVGVIAVQILEQAITDGRIQFIALGDRHSFTKVGSRDCIWYSGTPEATDFSETRSGYALVADIDDQQVSIKEVQVGQWCFVEHSRVDLNSSDDVDMLSKLLEETENKERTALRLKLVGSLSLSLRRVLEDRLLFVGDVFASLDVRDSDLLVVPDDTDFADLGFSGFADKAVQRLRNKIEEGGEEGIMARDALMLLLRLARERK